MLIIGKIRIGMQLARIKTIMSLIGVDSENLKIYHIESD